MAIERSDDEGATRLDDISGLKLKGIKNRPQLDAAEADNILKAQSKYLSKKVYRFPQWYIVKHINLVHKAMFGIVWQWAGTYRTIETNIGVTPYKIPNEMYSLVRNVQYWNEDISLQPVEITARVHHGLVWIHPYPNGNGRHGRFIGDMILRSCGYTYVSWPSLSNNGKERSNTLTH